MISDRTTLHRRPERGHHDFAAIASILDEARICHLGFAVDGQPYVLPTTHARVDRTLYLHGAAAGRMSQALGAGIPVCVTATLLDALVLARSAMHHSMNYRSVVVLGRARLLEDRVQKLAALEALVNKVWPGRFAKVRPPSEGELLATAVLALPLEEASAKIRQGPPVDAEADYGLDVWAGEVPIREEARPPVADPRLKPGLRL